MRKPNIKEKILEFLIVNRRSTLTSGEIRDQIEPWMKKKYGYEGNLAVDRKWRELKEVPNKHDTWLKVETISSGSNQGEWRIHSLVQGGIETPWQHYIR